MSNQPNEEKPQKTFSEFQSGLVNLNLKRNKKRQANKGTDNKENDPFESDIANLLEQLKNQNNEIKNIGNSKNEININLKPSVPQPIIQPKTQSDINIGPSLPKQSLDFNFNIVTRDPGGNYSSSFSSSPTKKDINQPYYPPQIIQSSSVLNTKPKNSVIQEIQDVEELSIDSKNNKENEIKPKVYNNIEEGNTNAPFDFSNSQAFHIENNPSNKQKNDLLTSGDNNLKMSTNYFLNPKQSNNMGFVVEMDSDVFDKDKNQSSKGLVNEIDKVPIVSSHRVELKPELNNEFNFDVNEIVNNLSDGEEKEKQEQKEREEKERREREEKEKKEQEERKRKEREREEREREEKEREERERDRILKEEEERLERERLEKEEEERREIERIKKERLEKEKKEKEEKEKKLKEKREKRERERIEREKKEKEEKERLKREKEEELKKKKEIEESENKEQENQDSVEELGIKVVEIDDFEFDEDNPPKKDSNIRTSKAVKPESPKKMNEKQEEEEKDQEIEHKQTEPKNEKKKKSLKSQPKKTETEEKKEPEESEEEEEQPQSKINTMNNNPSNKAKQKYLDSLNPEVRRVVSTIIDHIETFDVTSPDLSDLEEYTHIPAFDRRDQDLHQIIPSFKETLIYPEGSRVTFERRINCLNHFFFQRQGTHKKVLDYAGKVKISHPNLVEKLFEERQNNYLSKYKISEEEIFKEDNIDLESPLPIGSLENLETFCYKYSLNESPKTIEAAYSTFSHWREVLLDGNSFYRVAMFSLIENFILEENSEELQKIACEINQDKFKDIMKEKAIDHNVVMSIFRIIIDNINKKNSGKAYELLIKAYQLKSKDFDYGLIAYLRKLSYDYISETVQIYLDSNKGNGEKLKETLFNIEAINVFGIEPDFFVVCIFPYLFDMNLKVFWMDNVFGAPSEGTIFFEDEEKKNIPLISIGYFFSGFFKTYQPELDEKDTYFKKVIAYSNIRIRQLSFIPKSTKHCEVCKKKTKQILFLEKKFSACFQCLSDHAKKIMAKRAKTLYLSNFIGIEYYTRPIHLKNGYYLDDYDYIELFVNDCTNMSNDIYNWITSSCFSCNQKMDKKELKIMKCLCRYCETCILQKIAKATQNLKVINRYEIAHFEKVICECNMDFDSNEAVRLLNEDISKETDEAKKRMTKYVGTLCMVCCKELVKYEEKDGKMFISQISKYSIIKIKQENDKNRGIDYLDIPHLICPECGFKESKKREEKINNKKTAAKGKGRPEEPNSIICKICRKKHYIGKGEEIRGNDGKCCGGGCIVF